ncbi:MAG: DUF1553 domain-containing protein [Limisphaerales bacterium]
MSASGGSHVSHKSHRSPRSHRAHGTYGTHEKPSKSPNRTSRNLLWALGAILVSSFGPGSFASESAPHFERDIRPILKAHCFQCHGEGDEPKGKVDLRLRRFMLGESSSGRIIVPGKPDQSVLLDMVVSRDMPRGDTKLTESQIALIERWIAAGAPTLRPEPESVPKFFITEEERAFWSFQPIQATTPPPPRPADQAAARSDLDSFLLERLEASGLTFAPPADRATWIRRVTFDLTGLPPTPEEVESFCRDESPGAHEHVVDRLLASPRYGERWARHWLDVAGYADSNGGSDADSVREWAWRYRDYVIRSFNDDKPMDVFITEQLAGDELVSPPFGSLVGEDLDRLIATGFLRMAPDPTGDNPPDPDLARNQVVADTLQIVASSLLGLTVQCAQCHDHRYDPIPQSDYYRLRAVFEPAFDWKRWKNPDQRLVSLMTGEDRQIAECFDHAAAGIDREAQALHDELIEQFVQKQLERVPVDLRESVIAARRTPAAQRTDAHKKLLREHPTFQDHIILGEIDAPGAKRVAEIRKRAEEIRGAKPSNPRVRCLTEEPGNPVDTFLFHRGDPAQPGGKIQPGGLSVLPEPASADFPATNGALRTTGRRLAFARSLTSGRHPLTPRVLVNRVWHHHFGRGLVPTLADFGALGERPSHPELLDWLANEFVASGWKLKSLHRLIVTSAAYRQGSVNAESMAADPDNRLLGRFSLRRLDAESLRDSLLAIAGRLNTEMYGPPVPVAFDGRGQVVVGSQNRDGNGDPTGAAGLGGSELRRSVYLQVRRSMPLGILEPFDAPAINPNCEVRPVSTVAPQALMFLNDQFVLDRANDVAERLRRESPPGLRAQINLLWRLVHGVEPTEDEMRRSLIYLAEQTETLRVALGQRMAKKGDKEPAKSGAATGTPPTDADPSLQALASLCQALLASNRFLYLD